VKDRDGVLCMKLDFLFEHECWKCDCSKLGLWEQKVRESIAVYVFLFYFVDVFRCGLLLIVEWMVFWVLFWCGRRQYM
jgi:hypothetical protein